MAEAKFGSAHGLTLVAILEADGWSKGKTRKSIVLMVKQDHQSVNINPNIVWKADRVESICRNAGITAERYVEILDALSVEVATLPPPLPQ